MLNTVLIVKNFREITNSQNYFFLNIFEKAFIWKKMFRSTLQSFSQWETCSQHKLQCRETVFIERHFKKIQSSIFSSSHLCFLKSPGSKVLNPIGEPEGPKLTKHELTTELSLMVGLPEKRAQYQQICTLYALPLSDIMSEITNYICGILYLKAFSSPCSLSSFSQHTE